MTDLTVLPNYLFDKLAKYENEAFTQAAKDSGFCTAERIMVGCYGPCSFVLSADPDGQVELSLAKGGRKVSRREAQTILNYLKLNKRTFASIKTLESHTQYYVIRKGSPA